MRKTLALLTITLMLAGCGKVYECECTWDEGPLQGSSTITESEKRISSNRADEWCDEHDEVAEETRGECDLK